MKIIRIDAFQLRWTPDEKPTQHSAFVRIFTDQGIDGIGEASPMQGGRASLGIIKHDLAPAFAHVSDDLRTQYTLGYYAPQKGGDVSGLRHIEIRMKDPALREKYKLRYRTAYYGNR